MSGQDHNLDSNPGVRIRPSPLKSIRAERHGRTFCQGEQRGPRAVPVSQRPRSVPLRDRRSGRPDAPARGNRTPGRCLPVSTLDPRGRTVDPGTPARDRAVSRITSGSARSRSTRCQPVRCGPRSPRPCCWQRSNRGAERRATSQAIQHVPTRSTRANRRRRRARRRTTAATPALAKTVSARCTPSQVDRPPADPWPVGRLVERREPSRLPRQLDRVVIAESSARYRIGDIGRQLLAEPHDARARAPLPATARSPEASAELGRRGSIAGFRAQTEARKSPSVRTQ